MALASIWAVNESFYLFTMKMCPKYKSEKLVDAPIDSGKNVSRRENVFGDELSRNRVDDYNQ